MVTIGASAADTGSGLARIDLLLDGSLFRTLLGPNFSVVVDTTQIANGLHTLSARAVDQVGNIGAIGQAIDVTVANGPLISINPTSGQQGQQNLTVTITGLLTNWVQGTTTVDFGAGVTVAFLTVNSPTNATAVLNIDSAAALGARTVTMTTGNEIETLPGGFTVTSTACVAPPSGMVGWWSGDGNYKDLISGNDGTPIGGMAFGTGEVGQAFLFNGTDASVQVVDAAHKLDLGTGEITIDAWINAPSYNGVNDVRTIVGKNSLSYPYQGYFLRLRGDNKVEFAAEDCGTGACGYGEPGSGAQKQPVRSNRVVADGTFHHVAGIRRADGTREIWVDGVLDNTRVESNWNTDNSNPLYIGDMEGDGHYLFVGVADEVQVFNRALSASEIQSIFAAGNAGECKSQPTISSISPNNGQQGQQNLSVTITGQFTNWVQGTTTADFGAGITVAYLTVNSPISATAILDIDSAAALGGRTVTLSTGSEIATLSNGFAVTSSACTAPPSGIVGWWAGDGSFKDLVGGNDGTGQNGASFGTGEVDQAFSFVKGTAAVSVPDNANLHFADFTIETWVNLQNPVPGGEDAILTKLDNQAARVGPYTGVQWFLAPGTHQLVITLSGTGPNHTSTDVFASVASVPVGSWTHLAVARQGNLVAFYINGVLDSSFVTTAPAISNTDPLVIGEFYDTSLVPPFQPQQNFGGLIDEVSVYKRALSASEIQSIFAASSAGKCKPQSLPVANASFEANNGFNNFCGGSCEYSTGLPIPGWNSTGVTGQWITGGYDGNPPAFDGSVIAYSAGGGAIWQDVATVTAGTTYTLQVEILHLTANPTVGGAQLEVGGVVVSTATGVDMGPGTWSNWTATYTATGADAGKTLTIVLTPDDVGGDWDFVRLNYSIPSGTPMLVSVNPANGQQGQQNLSVTLIGQFTSWVQGITTANFGAGITVASLTVDSPTSATAVVSIDAAAAVGARTVTLTTSGEEVEALANGFTVLSGTSVLVSITPANGQQGEQNLSVRITGQSTNWVQGATTADFGAGITVVSVTVNSPTSATALLDIDPAATLGARTVTMTTGGEFETLPGGFSVTSSACIAPPSGLVGLWSGDGNYEDMMSNNDGVQVGAVPFSTGEVGQAFSFDGTSGYVDVPTSNGLPSSTWTVEFWFFLNSNATSQPLVNNFNGTGSRFQIELFLDPTQQTQPTLRLNHISASADTNSNVTPTAGVWHHVAGVHSATAGESLYLDGALIAANPLANVADPVMLLELGRSQLHRVGEGTGLLNGLLDEVSIYDRALSASEIQSIFAAGSAGKCKSQPAISSINPNNGQQGQQNLSVNVNGQFTNWVQGTTTADFGAGIAVVAVTVTSPTSALVVIDIDPSATLGSRTVTLTTGNQTETLASGFAVTAIAACVTPPSGMVSWWPGDGNANDIVGSNTGTLQGGTTFTAGKVGQAFQFANGSSVSVPASPSLDLTKFTVDAWVFPTGNSQFVIDKGDIFTSNYLLVLLPDNRVQVYFDDDVNNFYYVNSSAACDPGVWCHVAGTYDGSTLAVYVNGIPSGSVSATGTPRTGQPLFMGGIGSGFVDEVEVFDRALSASEIQSIFAAGSAGKCKARPVYDFTNVNSMSSQSQLSLGFAFTTNSAQTVTALGWFDPNSVGSNDTGFATPHTVGIFDSNGNLLGSVTLSAGTVAPLVGFFRYAQLATPIPLAANTTYILAGTSGGPADAWTVSDWVSGFTYDPRIYFGSPTVPATDAARYLYQNDDILRDPPNHFSDFIFYAGPNLKLQ